MPNQIAWPSIKCVPLSFVCVQYPHVVRHALPVLPPVLDAMLQVPELAVQLASLNPKADAVLQLQHDTKKATMRALVYLLYVGRRAAHAVPLTIGELEFKFRPQGQTPYWRLEVRYNFPKNKALKENFQSVTEVSEIYNDADTEEVSCS